MAGFPVNIEVDIMGDAQVRHAIKLLQKRMSQNAAIRQIARSARKTMVASVKRAQKNAEKKEQKWNKNDRSRKYYSVSGNVSTFFRGHLEASIRDVSQDKPKWRRYPVLWLGPVYTGDAANGGKFTGEKGAVDAFYAHMMLGSKEAYFKQVIDKGFNAVKSQAGNEMRMKAIKVIEKEGKQAGFTT